MNSKRRSALKGAIRHLTLAEIIISNASEQETDCIDNIPENMSDSERVERMEEIADLLCDAEELVSDAIDKIEDAIG